MILDSTTPRNIAIVNSVIQYNEQKLLEISPEKIYTCEVCLDGVLGKQTFRFSACGHLFCRRCIRDSFESNLSSGLPGGPLRCLQCDKEVSQFEIRALLSKELYERYERTYHGEGSCASILLFGDTTLEEVAEMFEGADEELKKSLIEQFGGNNLKNLLNEHYTLKYKAEKTQRCPKCQAYVQRMEGCNAMQCFLCGEVFCWLCLKRLDARRKYDHYGSGPCSGKLFEAHAIDENQNEAYRGE
ncbi:E3 ubiquitin-protein ligase RNF14 [Taenia crassiceps]|uniref:E3 ubiquitin-protein ligase RNF14 n=1 Tax=Taenia crassiceps TaxID=6207 RepID=A0ABR4QR64_9CEST